MMPPAAIFDTENRDLLSAFALGLRLTVADKITFLWLSDNLKEQF